MNIQGKQWSQYEDQMLVEFHEQANCFQRWKLISCLFKASGIQKTELQCRDRYLNHLNPDLKSGKLTSKEIARLFECYDQNGPKWSTFENKIPGRSQNQLKNQFYSILRSFLRMVIKIGKRKKIFLGPYKSINFKAKFLLDLYEGKIKFSTQNDWLKKALKNIGYCIEIRKIEKYMSKFSTDFLKQLQQEISGPQELRPIKMIQCKQQNGNMCDQDLPVVKIENQNFQAYRKQNQNLCKCQLFASQTNHIQQLRFYQADNLLNFLKNSQMLMPLYKYNWECGFYEVGGYNIAKTPKIEPLCENQNIKTQQIELQIKL